MMENKPNCKKPCRECPFKKTSLPGYLGEASYDPQSFLQTIDHNLIPCHLAVDWEDDFKDPEQIAKNQPCIGALQFLKNSCKLPLAARSLNKYNELLKATEGSDEVFQWPHEFIQHHSKK